ncbi:CpaF family protein [Prosthecochloris sp. N3]|uniref:CpaF family protein n=1 Tax=Prosthecochloris ethylica TaxID=2743976 RepID=A0ABR9XQ30_9CHLB|nr:CpaF family protein [Prosthecochloris ethylica]MBF0586286.1 CpaF family protein [Prosthecochloris ethylica]MBF0635992.1 CpaF family protein [Prosthecochloris ethylica]NUK47333.1 CpaF family protein [Prosthecochloris ethylica]
MATLKDQIARWNRFTNKTVREPASSASANTEAPAQDRAHEGESSPVSASEIKPKPSPGVDYYATKVTLHQKLLSRIDLNAIESLTPEQLRNELGSLLVSLIEEDAIPLNHQERTRLVTDLKNEIMGLGPLEPLLADPAISEIMVNGYQNVYVEKSGRIHLTDIRFNDDAHLMKIIDKIVSRVGRRIDESCPMADARLPDGSRVNAIIAPLALDGPALTIRRFAVVPLQMHDLIEKNTLTQPMAELLSALVKVKSNIIISGGTGTGKTTLLNILSSYIPANERIVTIEDTAELQLQQKHVIRLETRPPNIEGKGEITMRALVKNSLRMRPDRIVLGEVRSAEVIDMLQAMNTGHEGSLTTIHANTPRDALGRLENLVGLGGISLPGKALRQLISSSIHFIVQITRFDDGTRKMTSIQELSGMEGDVITTQEIYNYQRTGTNPDGAVQGLFRATGIRPRVTEKIRTYGINLSEGMFDPGFND